SSNITDKQIFSCIFHFPGNFKSLLSCILFVSHVFSGPRVTCGKKGSSLRLTLCNSFLDMPETLTEFMVRRQALSYRVKHPADCTVTFQAELRSNGCETVFSHGSNHKRGQVSV